MTKCERCGKQIPDEADACEDCFKLMINKANSEKDIYFLKSILIIYGVILFISSFMIMYLLKHQC